MNNIQRKAKQMQNFNDYFLELAYEQFTIEFGRSDISTRNEGIIPIEAFLFALWLIEPDSLQHISFVLNHEGAWEFVLFKGASKSLSYSIKKAHSFQGIDDPSQIEIIFSEKERPNYPTIPF